MRVLICMAAALFATQAAQAERLQITIGDVEQALRESSQSSNALAVLASSIVNESLAEAGINFDVGQLEVHGDLPGGERPCTGFWSPGGEYDLILDSETGIELLLENLAEPIVVSVTLIGSVGIDVQYQWRVGLKIAGRCIRIARDTFTLSADADANVTITAIVEMNPELGITEDTGETAIFFNPVITMDGVIDYFDIDLTVSGLGGQYLDYRVIPYVGNYINDLVANVALDVLAEPWIEDQVDEFFNEFLDEIEGVFQENLTDWSFDTELTMPEIEQDEIEQIASLTFQSGWIAIPVAEQFYNDNRTELLFYFLTGDRRGLNNFFTQLAACTASAVLSAPMPAVSLFRQSGANCLAYAPTTVQPGPYYVDPECSNQVDFDPTDFIEYCSTFVEAFPNTVLGNAANLNDFPSPWQLAYGASVDVAALSIEDNHLPFFQRVEYREIDNRSLEYERNYGLFWGDCGALGIADLCPGVPPANAACVAQQTAYCDAQRDLPLGQSDYDFPVFSGNGICELEMRVYKRDIAETGLRALIMWHGGSWNSRGLGFFGMESMISHFTERGFAVFVPFYRLTGDEDGNVECNGQNWEGINEDAEAALQWVADNRSSYGAGVDQIAVLGQSAGAGLAEWLVTNAPSELGAAWTAYAPTDAADYISTYFQSTDPDFEPDPQFVLGPGPAALRDYLGEDLDQIDLGSPAVQLNSFPGIIAQSPAAYPQVFLSHGIADTLIPVSQSVRLCNGYAGDPDNGPATDDGGNVDVEAYEKAYICGENGAVGRLFAEAQHGLEYCIPGLACLSGSEPSRQRVASSILDGITFLRDEWLDDDADGIPDGTDNCVGTANPSQRDTDGDGLGNYCDPDLNNDGFVNFLDLLLLGPLFFTADPNADLNGDGIVNQLDLQIVKAAWLQAVGTTNPPAFEIVLNVQSTTYDGAAQLNWSGGAGGGYVFDVLRGTSADTSQHTPIVTGYTGVSLRDFLPGEGYYYYSIRACAYDDPSICGPSFPGANPVHFLRRPSEPVFTNTFGNDLDGLYVLTWNPGGAANVDYYRVTETPFDHTGLVQTGPPVQLSDGLGNFEITGQSLDIGGRANGQFRYLLEACNQVSCGLPASSQPMHVMLAPDVPTGFSAQGDAGSTDNDGQFPLLWTTPGVVNDTHQWTHFKIEESFTDSTPIVADWNDAGNRAFLQTCVFDSAGCGANSAQQRNVSVPVEGYYFYRIRTCNYANCSSWVEAGAPVFIPGLVAPSNLDGPDTVYPGDAIEVTWSPVGPATHYEVYRSFTGNLPPNPITTTVETSYSHTPGGSHEVTFYYWVAACDVTECGPLAGPLIVFRDCEPCG